MNPGASHPLSWRQKKGATRETEKVSQGRHKERRECGGWKLGDGGVAGGCGVSLCQVLPWVKEGGHGDLAAGRALGPWQEQSGWPDGGSRSPGEWVQNDWKDPGCCGSRQLFGGGWPQREAEDEPCWRRWGSGGLSRASALVGRCKWGPGYICSGIKTDPGTGPVDGTGKAGTGVVVVFSSGKSSEKPGRSRRQVWSGGETCYREHPGTWQSR